MKICLSILFFFLFALAAPVASSADVRVSGEFDAEDADSTDVVKIRLERSPVIAVHYGFTSLDRDDLDASFGSHGALDIRLGYSVRKPLRWHDGLFERESGYVFMESNATDFAIEDVATDELESESWRFGICFPSGYGYDIGASDASLLLYHSNGLGWTIFDIKSDPSLLSDEDKRLLDPFDGDTRFGTTWEGGIRIAPTKMLGFEAGYEGALVFPRTQVWYFALATAVEGFALQAVDGFVDAISATSPRAAPIVKFLLANGVSYGFHELRKTEMHWPIESAPPLTYDTFKFGICVTF